jgi:hypothetical protein
VEGQLGSNEEFSLFRYVGEYFREAGVLIFVFGFLDPLVPQGDNPNTLHDRLAAFPGPWALLVVIISLGFLAVGILSEWLRKR